MSGTLLSYGDRAPLSGVSVVLGSSVATTDGQGKFSLANLPASGAAVLTASAPGHLFRGVGVSLSQAPTAFTFDAIRDALPFSLLFYRAWARNLLESAELQVTKPWTRSPSFYVQMLVEGTTTRVDPAVVDRIRDLFEKSVPELSGGKFRVAAFETGDTPRPAQEGWVNLTFYPQLGAAFGTSTVGGNSGTMSIRYGMVSSVTTNPNNCMTPEVSIADHEITHTMGFWHTPNVLVRFLLRHRLSRRAAARLHSLSLGADVLAAGRQSRSGHRPGACLQRSRARRSRPGRGRVLGRHHPASLSPPRRRSRIYRWR